MFHGCCKITCEPTVVEIVNIFSFCSDLGEGISEIPIFLSDETVIQILEPESDDSILRKQEANKHYKGTARRI